EVATPAEMAELSAVPVAEVVRVETVAASLAGGSSGPGEWAARIKGALGAAAAGAVGLKTIVAYRYGLDLDPVRPSPPEVAAALDGWFRDSSQGGFRLTSPVLLRHLLHEALDLASSESLPFQVHAGFGDPDLTLHRSDPSLFTPWVRLAAAAGVDIVFLHCYPYHRQAGYLAEVFANCYFDVGCALNYTGPSAGRVLAEALEMAPFTKMLYSSDAFGLAELVYLGALQFRRHLAAILDGFVERGECGRDDARRITAQLAVGNARRIYPFERAADPKAPAFSSERSS
ncbi:MAG: amidohydrolase family protein, partial [Acidimicrobiales bacterium]